MAAAPKVFLTDPKRMHLIKQHRSEQQLNNFFAQPNVININLQANVSQPPMNSRRAAGTELTSIMLGEMDSSLDKVYQNHILRVTTIEDPLLGYSSLHLLVQDDKGEVIVMCIYNVPQNAATCAKYAYGTKLEVVNPYHRIAMDRSIILRVDNPASVAILGTKPDMCRYCGEENAPQTCARCKRAKYCSKECQNSDSTRLNHKLICGKATM